MERRDVFISYIEEDGAMARALATELRAQGHSTWTYEEDGVPGISYLTQVNTAIEACHAFVLMASSKSVNAHQVIREVEQAHEREKLIIAVRAGLTHQQFIAANPILRMASGTAVTLSAEGDLLEIARRIVAAIRSIYPPPQDMPDVPVRTLPADAAPADATREPRSWRGISIVVGLILQVGCGGWFSAVAASRGPDLGLVLGPVPGIVAVLCGLLLLRSFHTFRRASSDAKTMVELGRIKRACAVSSIACVVGVVDGLLSERMDSGTVAAVSLLPALIGVALSWNGLRMWRLAT